jgi:hypothetical protein
MLPRSKVIPLGRTRVIPTRLAGNDFYPLNSYGNNLVTNGNMELDSNWVNFSTPAINERSSTYKVNGAYSRHFTEDAAFEGIQSDNFTVVAGKWYKVEGWFYRTDVNAGSVILSFRYPAATVIGAPAYSGNKNVWIYLSGIYQSYISIATAFVAVYCSANLCDLYCDDISVRQILGL